MKRTISLLLVSVLTILLMLSGCENKTQASGGGVSTQSAYLEGFRPRFSTGTAYEEIAAQNPLDKAFVRETDAIANAASDEMLEVTLRYGDYWKDEMSNAFSLANGAASSEQSISLQNEQESWELYADDHLTLAGVMTSVGSVPSVGAPLSMYSVPTRSSGFTAYVAGTNVLISIIRQSSRLNPF